MCVHAHVCVRAHACTCVCACEVGCMCVWGWVPVGVEGGGYMCVCVRVYPIIQVITKIYLLYFLCMAKYLHLQMSDNKMQNLM